MSDKYEWPELVGMDAKAAAKVIEQEKRGAQVSVHKKDDAVTADYRDDRVRIFTDERGKVAYPPQIG